MTLLGLKLSTWIKHPLLAWDAFRKRNLPVVDLDNPENNCSFCGVDHHYGERIVSEKRE